MMFGPIFKCSGIKSLDIFYHKAKKCRQCKNKKTGTYCEDCGTLLEEISVKIEGVYGYKISRYLEKQVGGVIGCTIDNDFHLIFKDEIGERNTGFGLNEKFYEVTSKKAVEELELFLKENDRLYNLLISIYDKVELCWGIIDVD